MKFIEFIRRLIAAFRHVKNGGKRPGQGRRARRAGPARPSRWCEECQQPGPAHDHDDDHEDEREGER